MKSNKEAVVFSITLGRRLLGTFLTIFFPTILLNVIGYSTNYFKEFFFEVDQAMFHLIIKTFLLGCNYRESHINVGPDDDVHQRE